MNSRGDDESAGRAGATGDEAARSVMQRQIELLICFIQNKTRGFPLFVLCSSFVRPSFVLHHAQGTPLEI